MARLPPSMTDPVAPPPMSSAHRWALVLLAVLMTAISFLERQTLAALAPTICRDLGLSNSEYGWAGAAFGLAHLVGAPLAGHLLDRVGVRRGLVVAVVLWSLVSAAHGLAAGFGSVILLRVLLGLAEGPTQPGSAQVLRSVLLPADVPRGMGLVFTGGTLGAIAALFVAVALEQRFGWRAAFGAVAALSMSWIPLWMILSSAGTAPALLQPARRDGGDSARSAFSHPAVVRSVAFLLCVAPTLAFGLLWAPKFLVARYLIPQAEVGRYAFAVPLACDLGAIIFGDLASRARRRGLARSETTLLLVACSFCLVLALPLPDRPWPAIALCSVAYFGVGGALAINGASALLAVPRSMVSRAGGMLAAGTALSFVVINPLIGWSVDLTGSYRAALTGLALLILPAAAVWLLVGRRSRAGTIGPRAT